MSGQQKIDPLSGTETTGHEWDGITELNTPLPKWWLYTFYTCIVWSVIYWIAMPAWPLISGYTTGVLGYSQRQVVASQLAENESAKATFVRTIALTPLEKIPDDAETMRFALAGGAAAFGDNCAGCHGSGAEGGIGYPNLNDDNWLWGGTLEDIHKTLLHGIRWEADENTRANQMPAYGRDGLLSREEVAAVADYVLSLSGSASEVDAEVLATGEQIFAEQCVACHMEGGVGNQELGSPNLTDAIWLYGGDRASVIASIHNARAGVMPAWQGRLDASTIKQLTLYVHSLGGGE